MRDEVEVIDMLRWHFRIERGEGGAGGGDNGEGSFKESKEDAAVVGEFVAEEERVPVRGDASRRGVCGREGGRKVTRGAILGKSQGLDFLVTVQKNNST